MFETFLHNSFSGLTYIRKNPQLLLTVVLIVVIPIAFFISGQQFLNASKSNQETLELDRIGILHDMFVSFVLITKGNTEEIQAEILRIGDENSDFVTLQMLEEVDRKYIIVGSRNPQEIGTIVDELPGIRITEVNPDISYILKRALHGIRYWDAYRKIVTEDKVFYLYTRTSLEYIDAVLSERILKAYLWLIGIIFIILFLIVRHIRLIDYAYLYSETKKASQMKDLFSNMIAHELRSPLTAIRGFSSIILEENAISPQTQNAARKIENSAARLLEIVNDLLDVARMHSGKLSFTATGCDVRNVVHDVLETMKAFALEKKITLSYEGSKQPIIIKTDEKRLYQALTNLVSNSLKYTKAGEIVVSIEEKSSKVEIRVKDTGMGIRAEDQQNLFAPFFRVENTEMDGTVGTGLGMWITKQLIELMHGSIGVESIRGVGTHIIVILPKE